MTNWLIEKRDRGRPGLTPRSKDKAPALTDCSTPQHNARVPFLLDFSNSKLDFINSYPTLDTTFGKFSHQGCCEILNLKMSFFGDTI